ncbi:YopJ family acetyltransferase [Paraburkholderia sp. CI3]|uniref:YopJ family acetyltransferase n=1 Tax=Paraburkholderia sp. CI3 TaxID=2991060 RepID=UPI003D1D0205
MPTALPGRKQSALTSRVEELPQNQEIDPPAGKTRTSADSLLRMQTLSKLTGTRSTSRRPPLPTITSDGIHCTNASGQNTALDPEELRRCESAIADLKNHKKNVEDATANGYQPDESDGDMKCLPLLVEAQNALNPGLKLLYFDSPDHLAEHVDGRTEDVFHQRAVIRAHFPRETVHHFVVDIYKENGKVSLIAVDTVELALFTLVHCRFISKSNHTNKSSLFVTESQNSPSDCTIFSLSHGKKMADHANRFVDWHRLQLSGRPIAEGATKKDKLGLDVFEHGCEILPLSFSKHMQSRKRLKEITAKRSDANRPVNKLGKTLKERFESNVVTRKDRSFKERTYSGSIEAKRLLFIKQAIDYFESRIAAGVLRTSRKIGDNSARELAAALRNPNCEFTLLDASKRPSER